MGTFERHRYPADWEDMALDCKMRAGWRCEQCGVHHGAQRIGKVHGTLYTVYIAACHVNHDPENPDAVLISLCPACHMRMDGVQHSRTRKRKQRQAERARQRAAGQIGFAWLTPGEDAETALKSGHSNQRSNLVYACSRVSQSQPGLL